MKKPLKLKLYEIVFEADTPAGKAFDVILLIAVLFSALVVMLESIESIFEKYHTFLKLSEWTITVIFTLEYFLRIWLVEKKPVYIFSFYGLIDFFSDFLPFTILLAMDSISLSIFFIYAPF